MFGNEISVLSFTTTRLPVCLIVVVIRSNEREAATASADATTTVALLLFDLEKIK